MVRKRGEKLVFYLLFVIMFLFSLSFICADGLISDLINVSSPVRWGNYSTFINVSIRTNYVVPVGTIANNYNVTLYCNKTSGTVGKTGADIIKIITMTNTSSTQRLFENATVRIDSIILGSNNTFNYNCSVYADNYTNYNWSVSAMWNITFDSLPPAVSFSGITNTIHYGNYTSIITVNVSVIKAYSRKDANVSSVWFNVTYTNGTQINFTQGFSIAGDNYYNITIPTTTFIDGGYNITIFANDTALTKSTTATGYANGTNLNNSVSIYVVFDKTAPTVSYSCSPSSAYVGDIVTCSCSGTDVTSGIRNTTLTSNPVTSNTGVHTLSCTITDEAGNSETGSTTYTIELYSSFSPGGGSSTTTSFIYSKTIPQISADFSSIQSIETSSFSGGGLGAKERIKIKFKEEEHYIGVRSLTTSSATIEIASTPSQVDLDIGEETKKDLDDDGYYDVYIKLNSITNGKADLTINYIHEQIPAGTTTTGEEQPSGTTGGEETTTGTQWPIWVWVIIGVVILIIIGGGIVINKKRK